MEMEPERTTFRADVPEDAGIYVTFGMEWFKNRFKVINLSDTGIRFITHEPIREGAQSILYIRFPGLEAPLEVNVIVIRAVRRVIDLGAGAGGEDEKALEWDVACHFEGISIGMQDRILHEVRKLERQDIMNIIETRQKKTKKTEHV